SGTWASLSIKGEKTTRKDTPCFELITSLPFFSAEHRFFDLPIFSLAAPLLSRPFLLTLSLIHTDLSSDFQQRVSKNEVSQRHSFGPLLCA
ncbi:hypothetical protein RB213_001303, partial [Colletotrichum asianum]